MTGMGGRTVLVGFGVNSPGTYFMTTSQKVELQTIFKIFIFYLIHVDAESFIVQKILVIFRSNRLTGIK